MQGLKQYTTYKLSFADVTLPWLPSKIPCMHLNTKPSNFLNKNHHNHQRIPGIHLRIRLRTHCYRPMYSQYTQTNKIRYTRYRKNRYKNHCNYGIPTCYHAPFKKCWKS